MPLICEFIASRRQEYGVTPICRALGVLGVQIAPRTYRAHLARPPSKRALWDAAITEVLAGHYEPDEQGRRPPECLYGATKMWAQLNREGIEVARCTVERLMRANGWRGVTRTKRVRTTVADPAAARPSDLVDRQFHAAAPGLLRAPVWVWLVSTRTTWPDIGAPRVRDLIFLIRLLWAVASSPVWSRPSCKLPVGKATG
jgi:hypothetical protein